MQKCTANTQKNVNYLLRRREPKWWIGTHRTTERTARVVFILFHRIEWIPFFNLVVSRHTVYGRQTSRWELFVELLVNRKMAMTLSLLCHFHIFHLSFCVFVIFFILDLLFLPKQPAQGDLYVLQQKRATKPSLLTINLKFSFTMSGNCFNHSMELIIYRNNRLEDGVYTGYDLFIFTKELCDTVFVFDLFGHHMICCMWIVGA